MDHWKDWFAVKKGFTRILKNRFHINNKETLAYLVLLANAVSTGLSLQVILWIPITIKDDDSVSSR